jgi:hypothetical protein
VTHVLGCNCQQSGVLSFSKVAAKVAEDHAMWLIRNGYAVSTRGGFSGTLFSALLALALFDPGAATGQEGKQIKLGFGCMGDAVRRGAVCPVC